MSLNPYKLRPYLLPAAFALAILPALNLEAQAVPLEGKIEHVETMPQIEPQSMPGARFSGSINESDSDNRWVRIPKWLTGTWTVKEETCVFKKDFRTGKASSDPFTFPVKQKFSYGHQQDDQGHIWHYLGTPYTSQAELPNFTEYHKVRSKTAQELSDQAAAFRSEVTVTRVRSGIVREAFQQESVTRYAPEDLDTISMAASTKQFDATGAPIMQQDNQARIRRSASFKRVDSEHGRNLRQLFEQFIAAQRGQ